MFLSLLTLAPVGRSAEAGFIASLDSARLADLKLDRLTVAERAALDAAIQVYVNQTVIQVRHAEAVKNTGRVKQAAELEFKLESRIAGPFLGWSGNTLFRFENGQIWQQVGSDNYYHVFPQGTEVTIYPVGLGGFRLSLPTGATVAVRRR